MGATNFYRALCDKISSKWWTLFLLAPVCAISLTYGPPVLAGYGGETIGTGDNIEVTPGEDLMREHGVLRRTLMVYEAALAQLPNREFVAKNVISKAALLIQRFIENYHEKMEEDFIFPRCERVDKLKDLVNTLKEQHERGRVLTRQILQLSGQQFLSSNDRSRLSRKVHAFIVMYRAHAAREDTILFPEFHKIVGQRVYERMGEQFEQREHQLLGDEGFEGAVALVAALEQEVGIGNLSSFTPPFMRER